MTKPQSVGLLITCLADLMRPEILQATLALLTKCNINPIIPQAQTCCGQPALNSGRRSDARDFARKLADEFSACDQVVAPSGSCIGTVKTHYPKLFAHDEPGYIEVKELANKCYELSQFLEIHKFKADKVKQTQTIAFHDSCAGLRELGIKQGPRKYLSDAGHTLVPLPDEEVCCGFGGTFSVKFGEVSAQMADDKCVNAMSTKADVLAMGDLGCMLNIEGRLSRRGDTLPVKHWAQLLID